MNEFMQNYINETDKEFEVARYSIERLKYEFKSTDWTDAKAMIKAGSEIWRLENRLKDAMEVHSLILEMKKEA